MLKIFNVAMRDKVERWSSPSGASKGVPRESQYRSENYSLFFAPLIYIVFHQ